MPRTVRTGIVPERDKHQSLSGGPVKTHRSPRGCRLAGLAAVALLAAACPAAAVAQPVTPIQHVVILDLENHSFGNVLGFWCRTAKRPDGSARCGPGDAMPASVTLKDGTVVTPSVDPDVVPKLNHTVAAQVAAMDGGKMDGWGNITQGPGGSGSPPCDAATHYECVSGYQPAQDPNITALAGSFAMEDRFFSLKDSPSWGGHLYAVAGTTDGFTGDNPAAVKGVTAGPGWGCDSDMVAPRIYGPAQPSCVPDFALSLPNGGAFRPTPVLHVPTIMDELDAAGMPWRIYGAASPRGTRVSLASAATGTSGRCAPRSPGAWTPASMRTWWIPPGSSPTPPPGRCRRSR
jgi:hypothetical protein